MSEPICYCGHVLDEHDDSLACGVMGCACFHFDQDHNAEEGE